VDDGAEANPPAGISAGSGGGWWRWLSLAALPALAVAVYAPAWRGGFIWDDLLLVRQNPLVTGEFTLRSIWFRTDFPLSTVVLWFQWLAWGDHAPGYHAVNVALHALNALLVWRVLRRMNVPGAWLAGALFAVHPVCVGTVAWISEIKNTLSLLFYLLAFRAWLEYAAADRSPQKPLAYALSLLAFVLALLAKTSAVMLPVVLLLWAWWQRGRVSLRDVARTVPFFALSLGFGLLTIWFQAHHFIIAPTAQPERFLARLAGAGLALWFYLGKALWPVGLSLIYPRWTIEPASVIAWLPLLGIVLVAAGCWRFRWERGEGGRPRQAGWGRHALFGLGFFALNLLPVLGLLDMHYLAISRVSDHFQYLPILGVMALAAAGLRRALPGRGLLWIAAPLVLGLGCLAWQRAGIVADEETVWRDTLAKNPASWTAHNNLGCLEAERQQFGKAIEHFSAAIRLRPRNAQAHANLGKALAAQNRFAEAAPPLRKALELDPGNAETHRQLGTVLAAQNQFAEAARHLEEAARLRPEAGTFMELSMVLRQAGDTRQAIARLRQAIKLEPNASEALNNLAWLLATCPDDTLRNGVEAVQLAEQACRLTKDRDIVPIGTLSAAYAEAGRFEEAMATAQRGYELARAANDRRFAGILQLLLKSYQAGKPWRDSP
jgi:tetratricopeptide (TPR) repeat protein